MGYMPKTVRIKVNHTKDSKICKKEESRKRFLKTLSEQHTGRMMIKILNL